MFGISSKGKDQISLIIEDMFDNIAMDFIGNIPRLKDKKRLVISASPNMGLSHLFVQSMNNHSPNELEKEFLKGLLLSADGYIESVKNKTRSNVIDRIDGLVRESKINNTQVDPDEMQNVINDEFMRAKANIKIVAEAEASKVRNLGTAMQISRAAAVLEDSDPTVLFVTMKDSDVCSECKKMHTLDGITPRLWRFSDLKHGYHKRGEENPSIYGCHPNCRCLYDGNSPVITENGIKSLKNVEIGDRVLTHTGKFKKVLATFGKEGIPTEEDLYRIEFTDPFGKTRKLRTTGDHLMMTDTGWKRTDQLIPGTDCLQYLFQKCEFCDNIFPHDIQHSDKRFCSRQCVNDFKTKNGLHKGPKGRKQPKEEIERRTKSIVKAKHEKSEKLGKRSEKQFICKECSIEFTKSMGYIDESGRWVYRKGAMFCSISCGSKYTAKNQWSKEEHRLSVSTKNSQNMKIQYSSGERVSTIDIARKALYLKGGGPSKDQITIFNMVKSIYPDAEIEYPVSKYFADIAIPSINTIVEWDGGGHWISVYSGKKTMEQKINEDKHRDENLNKLGWHVIRYNEQTGFDNVLSDIRRVSLNSTNGYTFNNVTINKIVKVPSNKKSKISRLYDITVEEDASFVILGVISHNCHLTYLSRGFGFDKDGKIQYIDENHDEYLKQKK